MSKTKLVNIQYLPSDEERDRSKQLKAGNFLWPGFSHTYPVFSKQVAGGKFRFQTGLDLSVTPEDKKEEITQVIKELEEYFGAGQLDPYNNDFWKDIKLVVNKKNMFLDVTNRPEDKLLYYVIKGGGIFEIASSYDQAYDTAQPKKWYMVEPEEQADLSAMSDRVINRAIYMLGILDEEKSFDDMFLVHKVLITSDKGTTKQTPKSALYKDLSDFIRGTIGDRRKTPKQFVEAMETLKEDKKKMFVTAYVKEASYFNFLIVGEDNQFQNIETKTKYGASIDNAVKFLTNPANQHELENVQERVEKKWAS